MKKTHALLLAALALTFSAQDKPRFDVNEDARFEAFSSGYITDSLWFDPGLASVMGEHRYDGELRGYKIEEIRERLAFERASLADLQAIDPTRLEPGNRIDFKIVKTRIESSILGLESIREYEWNPLYYNFGNSLFVLISRDFAPIEQRLRNMKGRLLAVPDVLAAAKANLTNPPRPHTETAISQNKGNISLIRDTLEEVLAPHPGLKAELAPARQAAIAALESYGRWLETDLLPRSTRDFRIGDELFRKKQRLNLDTELSKEQILEMARNELAKTQAELYEVGLPLHREFFPEITSPGELGNRAAVIGRVLSKLAQERPTNETVVAVAEAKTAEATEFVRAKDLVTLPTEPVRVLVMPEFARGRSVAYCDAPGPLEAPGQQTYYAISPTPASWSQAQVDSFYSEYNHYMLADLGVHEAMPGHFLQIMHSNRYQGRTMIRPIFRNGSFVEGWAVYAEQMMAEAGFGGAKVRMQQLKMKLRVVINAIIDAEIHAGSMTEQQAMDLMMNEGYQERSEAAGKWRRAQISSTQLSNYLVGYLEVSALARDYRAAHERDPGFSLKKMHDLMLSFGSPPTRYLRELLKVR